MDFAIQTIDSILPISIILDCDPPWLTTRFFLKYPYNSDETRLQYDHSQLSESKGMALFVSGLLTPVYAAIISLPEIPRPHQLAVLNTSTIKRHMAIPTHAVSGWRYESIPLLLNVLFSKGSESGLGAQ